MNGKTLTIIGTVMSVAALILMVIGAEMLTFIVYVVLLIAGAGLAALGKKMEDNEADAQFNNNRT